MKFVRQTATVLSSSDRHFDGEVIWCGVLERFVFQYLYNQQDAQFFFVIRLYLQYTLYMFRTVSVHLQEQSFFISCTSHLVYAGTIRVAIATLQPHVAAYTKCDVQLIKVASDEGLIQSETCTACIVNKV